LLKMWRCCELLLLWSVCPGASSSLLRWWRVREVDEDTWQLKTPAAACQCCCYCWCCWSGLLVLLLLLLLLVVVVPSTHPPPLLLLVFLPPAAGLATPWLPP
jgi:hypothetical protein